MQFTDTLLCSAFIDSVWHCPCLLCTLKFFHSSLLTFSFTYCTCRLSGSCKPLQFCPHLLKWPSQQEKKKYPESTSILFPLGLVSSRWGVLKLFHQLGLTWPCVAQSLVKMHRITTEHVSLTVSPPGPGHGTELMTFTARALMAPLKQV